MEESELDLLIEGLLTTTEKKFAQSARYAQRFCLCGIQELDLVAPIKAARKWIYPLGVNDFIDPDCCTDVNMELILQEVAHKNKDWVLSLMNIRLSIGSKNQRWVGYLGSDGQFEQLNTYREHGPQRGWRRGSEWASRPFSEEIYQAFVEILGVATPLVNQPPILN